MEDNRIDPTLAFMADDYQPSPEEVLAKLEREQPRQAEMIIRKVENILNNCCNTSLELEAPEDVMQTLENLKEYLEMVLKWNK